MGLLASLLLFVGLLGSGCTRHEEAPQQAHEEAPQQAHEEAPQQAHEETPQQARAVEWQTYESSWFSVEHPKDFVVRPSLPSGDDGFDSVFFDAPDGQASFYVLSPQWSRKAEDIQLDPERERELRVEETPTQLGKRVVRTITAKDESNMRIVEETIEQGGSVYWVTAFEFRDEAARSRYAESYERFKASLEQYAD